MGKSKYKKRRKSPHCSREDREDGFQVEIKKFREKREPYVYSFDFSTSRKLTHEEIMKISKRGAKEMRKIIGEETGQDTDNYNSSSGIENR